MKRLTWPVASVSCAQRGPGLVSLMITVRGSGALTLSTHSFIAPDSAISGALAFSVSMVNTTSSAVSGVPSDHLTPWRRVIATVRKSALVFMPSACQGMISLLM